MNHARTIDVGVAAVEELEKEQYVAQVLAR
jgi:hypothetical protein